MCILKNISIVKGKRGDNNDNNNNDKTTNTGTRDDDSSSKKNMDLSLNFLDCF